MIKIAVIGSEHFERHMRQIQREGRFSQIQLCFISDYGSFEDTHRFEIVLEKIEKAQPQALVVGPYSYTRISPRVSIPCYAVHPTLQDFLLIHPHIEDYEKVAVILSSSDDIDIQTLEKCLNIQYHAYYYRNAKELPDLIRKLKRQGYEAVISNNITVTIAQREGMVGYYYFSCETIADGVINAAQIVQNLEREQSYANEVRSILDNASCGAIYITGAKPAVSFINRTALDILRRKDRDFIRKPLRLNFPENICDLILHSYEPTNNVQFSLCGVDIIANIVPAETAENMRSICLLFEKTDYILKRESIIRQGLRRQRFNTHYTFQDIRGKSPAIHKAIEQAKRFAVTDSTIFIQAETGAGKEVFAQSIHDHSMRREYPFVAINCASIPDTLIESELFGYTPGSFTGASSKGKQGLIELANHGTVFLDDVDGLSYSFQPKLLRVMQEREIIRIGGDSPIPVDVRFIVATNHSLKKMVDAGQFRNDLYFRINVLPLAIPPLRERKEDIPDLFQYYLSLFDYDLYQTIKGCFPEVFSPAFLYTYPGNVRELINITERFQSLLDRTRTGDKEYLSQLLLECIDISERCGGAMTDRAELSISGNYAKDLEQAERTVFRYYVEKSNCSMTELAKQLGISRATLYHKLREQREAGLPE